MDPKLIVGGTWYAIQGRDKAVFGGRLANSKKYVPTDNAFDWEGDVRIRGFPSVEGRHLAFRHWSEHKKITLALPEKVLGLWDDFLVRGRADLSGLQAELTDLTTRPRDERVLDRADDIMVEALRRLGAVDLVATYLALYDE